LYDAVLDPSLLENDPGSMTESGSYPKANRFVLSLRAFFLEIKIKIQSELFEIFSIHTYRPTHRQL